MERHGAIVSLWKNGLVKLETSYKSQDPIDNVCEDRTDLCKNIWAQNGVLLVRNCTKVNENPV